MFPQRLVRNLSVIFSVRRQFEGKKRYYFSKRKFYGLKLKFQSNRRVIVLDLATTIHVLYHASNFFKEDAPGIKISLINRRGREAGLIWDYNAEITTQMRGAF